MTTILDRPYQTEAVTSIWAYFATHTGNPIVVMPGGTGKSVVIARFVKSVFDAYPGQRVQMLTHVKELIQQNYEKLKSVWAFAPAGVFSAGLNMKEHGKPITFAGIASVAKKWALFGHVDLVIIDECHLLSPTDETMYQTYLAGLRSINPNLKVIGFTATPWRLGHGKLTDPIVKADGTETPSLFTDVCFDISGVEAFNRLIAEGYLLPLIPKRPKTVLSVDGVHMRGGEYIPGELEAAVDKYEITESALREVIEYGANRKKWLIFASGVDHAEHVATMLNGMGIPTGVVHSKRADRDATLNAHKAGQLRAVVNNNVLTTGYDDPEIDMIVGLRPTASTVLWVQILSRGTRPVFFPGYDLNEMGGRLLSIAASGKTNCLVLDFAGNTKRLGPINDPVVPKRKGQGGGEAPMKCCPMCDTWVYASVRFCNGILETGQLCNHEFLFETKIVDSAATDEIVKGAMPVVEIFKVGHIVIDRYTKFGSPPMMRVAYYCGLQTFYDYVCFEHQNFAGKKARDWWRLRAPPGMDLPATTTEALASVDKLKQATHLRVWVNKKEFPETLSYCFDGTAFGAEEVPDSYTPPEVELKLTKTEAKPAYPGGMDDDIPF
jgi:DNA repair protein RadD